MRQVTLVLSLISFITYSLLINKVEGILGGSRARQNQFKHAVSIQSDGNQACTGGILNNYHILTAAHCFMDEDNYFMSNEFTIIAGTIDLTVKSSSVEIKIIKVSVPSIFRRTNPHYPDDPNYRATGDIAIAKLERGLDINSRSSLSKLELPTQIHRNMYSKFINKEPSIAGFGYEEVAIQENHRTGKLMEVPTVHSYTLNYAKTKVMSNDQCNQLYHDQPISESHLCAKMRKYDQNPKGFCTGDSGGPLVLGKFVIGVAATSPLGCDEVYLPGVYTRVSSYISFIERAQRNIEYSDIITTHYDVD